MSVFGGRFPRAGKTAAARLGILLCLAVALAGCKTIRVAETRDRAEARADTIIETRAEKVFERQTDSVYVERAGDTIRVERWRTLWRDRERVCTLYVAKTDTVREAASATRAEEPPGRHWLRWLLLGAAALLAARLLRR